MLCGQERSSNLTLVIGSFGAAAAGLFRRSCLRLVRRYQVGWVTSLPAMLRMAPRPVVVVEGLVAVTSVRTLEATATTLTSAMVVTVVAVVATAVVAMVEVAMEVSKGLVF